MIKVWLRTLQVGVKSLLLHPLRTFLTTLGVFFGVASVIVLLALGEGISREAQRQIESLGADTIIVRSVKPPSELMEGRSAVPYGLTRSEYDLLLETVPTITSAVPIRELRRQFSYRDRLIDGRLVGCTPGYASGNRLQTRLGRFISDLDNSRRDTFCVLSSSVAERLFPNEDPIGKRVYVPEHKDYYSVIGVLQYRNPSAAIGGSLDSQDFSNDVYIPIRTLQQRIGDTIVTRRSGQFESEIMELNQITLKVDSVENVEKTAKLVESTLKPKHTKLNDIAVVVPLELLEQARTQRLMILVFMVLIAGISLLVGGIGIMNIMLATVTERTREIGVRRALGAKRSDIVRQFLIETVVLSVVGGVLGIIAGVLCQPLVVVARNFAVKYLPETMDALPDWARNAAPAIVPESIPLAFGIAVAVGILSGLYPAMRAARMNPIDALRHE
jgi:putative ABC transport system permease protein